MNFSYRIAKATNTHLAYVNTILFYDNNGNANAPQYYVGTYVACLVGYLQVVLACVLGFCTV